MTSKEFDLLMTLVVAMLKDGKTEEVIEMLENAKHEKPKLKQAV